MKKKKKKKKQWYLSKYLINSHYIGKYVAAIFRLCVIFAYIFVIRLRDGSLTIDINWTDKITLLTAHIWQKWKSVFLTCPHNEIYTEAVGLKKNRIILKKIMIFLNMWNLGQFHEIWYCQ